MKDSNNFIKLSKYYREHKLAHAYLIETNNIDKCLLDLNLFIKEICCPYQYIEGCTKCNICHLIETNEFQNYFLIEPNGNTIKKEQILDLKKKCAQIPNISKANVYVIKNAEKLNASSSNTMLKFLEEPFDNCYGFFITTNKENLLNTIQSRCENLTVLYNSEDIFINLNVSDMKSELLATIYNYLYKLEVEKKLGIIYNKDILLANYISKEHIEIIFKIILDIYDYFLHKKYIDIFNEEYEKFCFLDSSISKLENKKKLIVDLLNNINNNLNIELMLDKFVIEMSDING